MGGPGQKHGPAALIGDDYKRLVAGLWGFAAYRWLATFVILVWAVAALSPSLAGVVTATSALVELAGVGVGRHLVALAADQERRRWHGELTQQLFFESFWDALKGKHNIDIHELFADASRAATEDIKAHYEGTERANRIFPFSYWRSGTASFLGYVFGSATFYAAAWIAGEWLKGPH